MKRNNINIKRRIKEYFFVNPTSRLRVREIEKKLRLPLPSVIRYCKELNDEGILSIMQVGSVVFYTSDKTNERFLLEKRIYNLKSVYLSGLVEFLRMELSNPVIILFGSYAKGEDLENSDIDLYIETFSKKELELTKFENQLRRKIQVFKQKSLKEIKNVHLSNNIINGILLNGFVEVFK